MVGHRVQPRTGGSAVALAWRGVLGPQAVVSGVTLLDDMPCSDVGRNKVEKDEEDDMMEDDEMVEAEGEAPSRPQTAAERTAARRKMKRFRYEQYEG